jgi:predicted lipoprotein with Yx(FWY)xxD motif
MRRITLLIGVGLIALAAPLAIATVVVGCAGSSSGYSSKPNGSTVPANDSGDAAIVGVGQTSLGPVLVDGSGRTLYLFEKDTNTASTCDGECATFWPPLVTTGKPLAGDGALASKLGTTERTDGKTEVSYNGHPLYYYVGDTKAGDTTGQGLDLFGAEWNVLSAAGTKIEAGG